MSIFAKDSFTLANVELKSTLGAGGHVLHHNVDSSALPTGAATSALQTSGTQRVIIASATDIAAITERPFTLVKGLCVNIGPTDPISDIPVVMDFAHHQVHEGETYRIQHSITATTTYLIQSPTVANPLHAPHMVVSADVYEGTLKIQIYENPTRGGTFAAGTVLNAFNRHRGSANTPNAVITHTPTDLTGGTLLETYYVGTGLNTKAAAQRSSSEIVLKSNEDYRVVVTEVVATTESLVEFDWYEDLGV